jgi:hypothetical protein
MMKGKGRLIAIILGVMVIVAIIVILLRSCGSKEPASSSVLSPTSTTAPANTLKPAPSSTIPVSTTAMFNQATSTSTTSNTVQVPSSTVPPAPSVTQTPTSTTIATTTTSSLPSPTPSPSPTQSPTPSPTPTIPNLTGPWTFTFKIIAATGVCGGDVGSVSADQIQITQNGDAVTLSGFQHSPANQLTGKFIRPPSALSADHWVIQVSGSYPEDGGITNSSQTFVINSANDMSGEESWDWSGGGGSCPGGKATVTATRS